MPRVSLTVWCPVMALALVCSMGFADAATVTTTGFTFDTVGPLNFVLTGGIPTDGHDFDNPADRIGKFQLDIPAGTFPVAGDRNRYSAASLSIRMSITDGDTNFGDVDFEDLIIGLGLTDQDADVRITPMFLTFFPSQPINDPPVTATNTIDLVPFPLLGAEIATLLSLSNGDVYLYIIDADDAGNRISLENSSTSDFDLMIALVAIPIPPALGLLGSALVLTLTFRRRVI